MYLSRLTLSRKPSVAALAELLNPADEGRRADAHHRLIWSAFAGDPAATRDFLWRDEGDGRFLVLSPLPPREVDLFETIEAQEFAPDLRVGDRLVFLLRANATRTIATGQKGPSGRETKDHRDVVMLALHGLPKGARAEARMTLADEAARRWLAGQGARAGFRLLTPEGMPIVEDYSVRDLPRRRGSAPRFGVLDMTGTIEVTEPAAFLSRIVTGFGRAKAFGCGLMLIRRA